MSINGTVEEEVQNEMIECHEEKDTNVPVKTKVSDSKNENVSENIEKAESGNIDNIGSDSEEMEDTSIEQKNTSDTEEEDMISEEEDMISEEEDMISEEVEASDCVRNKEKITQADAESEINSDDQNEICSDSDQKNLSDSEQIEDSDDHKKHLESENKEKSDNKKKQECNNENKKESDYHMNNEFDSEIIEEGHIEMNKDSDIEMTKDSDIEMTEEADSEIKKESDIENTEEADSEIKKEPESKEIKYEDEKELKTKIRRQSVCKETKKSAVEENKKSTLHKESTTKEKKKTGVKRKKCGHDDETVLSNGPATDEKMEKDEVVAKASILSPNAQNNKRIKSLIVDDHDEFDSMTPEGWKRLVVQRQGGASAGKHDVYYFSPTGKKLRSKKELLAECDKHAYEVDINLFSFAKSLKQGSSKGVMLTPKTPKVSKQKLAVSPPKKVKTPKVLNDASSPRKPKPAKVKSPFKVSSKGLIKQNPKGTPWTPPKSPFNLFQERLYHNPWQMLIGTLFLNKANGDEDLGKNILWEFIERWPTAGSVLEADIKDIVDVIKPLGTHDKRSKMILKFCDEYINQSWTYPKELHGIGKYGNDSYRIFCINEWRKVKPADYLLTFYVDWLWDNHSILGLD